MALSMPEPILSRILLREILALEPGTRLRRRSTRRVHAIYLLHAADQVRIRDLDIGSSGLRRVADGSQFQPGHRRAAVSTELGVPIGAWQGGDVVCFGGEGDAKVFGEVVGVEVEGGGDIAIGEVVVTRFVGIALVGDAIAGYGAEEGGEDGFIAWCHEAGYIVEGGNGAEGLRGCVRIGGRACIVLEAKSCQRTDGEDERVGGEEWAWAYLCASS